MTGIPFDAYVGTDVQNDDQAIRRLLQRHIPEGFASAGALVFVFLETLLASAWVAGKLFSEEEMLENSLFGYYALIVGVAEAEEKHGAKWEKFYLSQAVLLVTLCGWLRIAFVSEIFRVIQTGIAHLNM